MNNNRYCVIMAGGIGSRFWPVSRTNRPKQFLDILGTGKTFIRQTFERFLPIVPVENFLIVTHVNYKEIVKAEIPEISDDQILLEPIGRNTAPCIAYAAYKLKMKNPDASMVVTPSDHLVTNQHEFVKVIEEGLDFAEQKHSLVTIGISPSRPDTGYGYIQIDSHEQSGTLNRVKTFTEKPTLEVAEMFMASGEFFWNSGIFIWRVEDIVNEFSRHLPELNQLFTSILPRYNTPNERQAIQDIYPECRNISIDYGIMEKAENVYVHCADFGWSDIGTWNSLYEHAERDDQGNMLSGDLNVYDTQNSIIRVPEGKLGVVQGLDNYIVVNTEDVLMICRREEEQNIRRFVEDVRLKKNGEFI